MKKYIISLLPPRQRAKFKRYYESSLLAATVNNTGESVCGSPCDHNKVNSPDSAVVISNDIVSPGSSCEKLPLSSEKSPMLNDILPTDELATIITSLPTPSPTDPPLTIYDVPAIDPQRHKKSGCRRTCMKKFLLSLLPMQHQARIDMGLKPGNNRGIGQTEIFVPFSQTDTSMFFGDLRLTVDTRSSKEGNFGLGYRTIFGKRVYGVYVYGDIRSTPLNNQFVQGTVGFESLGEWTDIRLNTYWPTMKKYKINPLNNINLSGDNYRPMGNLLIKENDTYEIAARGMDLEFGFRIPFSGYDLTNDFPDLRVFAGFYAFNHSMLKDPIFGVRLRGEARIQEALEAYGTKGADLKLGVEVTNDNVRHTNAYFEARLSIPLQPTKEIRRPTGLRARLGERVIRDVDIVAVNSDPINPITGNFIKDIEYKLTPDGQKQRVFYVNKTVDQEGDGTYEKPFSGTDSAFEKLTQDYDIVYIYKGTYTQSGAYQLTADHITVYGNNSPTLLYTFGHNIKATNKSFTISGIILKGAGQNGDGINATYTDMNKHSISINNTDIEKKLWGMNINVTATDELKITTTQSNFKSNTTGGQKVIGNANTEITNINSTFNQNIGFGSGYGTYIDGAKFISTSSYYQKNSGTTAAYNAYIINSPSVEIKGSNLDGPILTGGAAYGLYTQDTTTVTLENSSFNSGSSDQTVYGYYAKDTATATITNSSFSNNVSSGNMAMGIYTEGTIDLTITNSKFNSNESEVDAPAYGLYLSDPGTSVKISKSESLNNTNVWDTVPTNYSAGIKIETTAGTSIVDLTGGVTVTNPGHYGIHLIQTASTLNLNIYGIGDASNTTGTDNSITGNDIGIRNESGSATVNPLLGGSQNTGNTTDNG